MITDLQFQEIVKWQTFIDYDIGDLLFKAYQAYPLNIRWKEEPKTALQRNVKELIDLIKSKGRYKTDKFNHIITKIMELQTITGITQEYLYNLTNLKDKRNRNKVRRLVSKSILHKQNYVTAKNNCLYTIM